MHVGQRHSGRTQREPGQPSEKDQSIWEICINGIETESERVAVAVSFDGS